MAGLKRNPGLLLIAIIVFIAVLSGCHSMNWSTNRFAAPPADATNSPQAPPPGGTEPPESTTAPPPREFSTERPLPPQEPESPAREWKKSVPAIQGRIELGPSTETPPEEVHPMGNRSLKPLPVTPDSERERSIPDGPEIPPFADSTGTAEPGFEVSLPPDVSTEEPVTMTVEVFNSDDRARGPFVLDVVFPDEIDNLTPTGDRFEVGRLEGGSRQTISVALAATAPGEHCIELKLSESDRELSWKKVCLNCQDQKLRVALTGPSRKPEGRRAEFTLSVQNVSDEAVGKIDAVLEFDRALIPVEASEGAAQRAGQLAWAVPVLQPGEALFLQVEFDCPLATRSACVTAEVAAIEVPVIRRKSCLAIERTPGTLQVVLSDENDLARAGQEVTAVLKVKNLGLQPARRIVAEIDLPESLELSDYAVYRGKEVVPLPSQVRDGVLHFESVGELRADQTLEYRVILRSNQSGACELVARVSDDLHTEPVEAREPLTITP